LAMLAKGISSPIEKPSWGYETNTTGTQMEVTRHCSLTAEVFNLSDSAGHINNFNDARGPQSYTAAFRIVTCFPDTQRTTCVLYVTMWSVCFYRILCKQRAGLAFVGILVLYTARDPVRQRSSTFQTVRATLTILMMPAGHKAILRHVEL
jgi:hypothetical protein